MERVSRSQQVKSSLAAIVSLRDERGASRYIGGDVEDRRAEKLEFGPAVRRKWLICTMDARLRTSKRSRIRSRCGQSTQTGPPTSI
jgi:hypothetical protein